MVVLFVFIIIGVVVGRIFTRDDRGGGYWTGDWTQDKIRIFCLMGGMLLGAGASFWGGSFVKKEIVVEKYFIYPMIFDGKIIAGLFEELPSYTFQIKEGDKKVLIKHCLYEKNIFFTDDNGERYLEVKRGKTCRRMMWVWFFYSGTGIIESKAVLKKGDEFLKLPRYYSL